MKLNNQEIQRYHRHRFPYLLTDCVEDIVPGKSARGWKNFSENEWLFHCNLHENEPVPYTMLIEILIEMSILPILMLEDNAGKITNEVAVDDSNVFREVYPGERLDVTANVKSWRRGIAVGTAEGFIGGELICNAKLTFVIPEIMEAYLPKK